MADVVAAVDAAVDNAAITGEIIDLSPEGLIIHGQAPQEVKVRLVSPRTKALKTFGW